MNHKTLHLIPVGLSDSPTTQWLPDDVRQLAARLDCYIAENAKTARAFLKLIETTQVLQEITIHSLSNKTATEDIRAWLKGIPEDGEIGLVSEAGCPAVADPGANVVAEAHKMGIKVVPWVGPSSILLALMASGLNGQQFAFNGYAPVKTEDRAKQLKAWEQQSRRLNQSQLFIETPYRNEAMFSSLLQNLNGNTRLCVARDITGSKEWIKTATIEQWKKMPTPSLDKQATLFLFLA
ncbi:MAG: SAM-dependent methyltransferase [Alcaligenaceae bacterium]|jgi:16S rRNA (cytidine1402-2'-O)-methyltransferase|nr:SAM-dependent methyltransferase [Alcaligenaceae bacterium]